MPKRPPKPDDQPSKPRHKEKKNDGTVWDAVRPPIRTMSDLTREGLLVGGFGNDTPGAKEDREVAIVNGALVERDLEKLIVHNLPAIDAPTFREMIKSGGVLASLNSKIHLGFAMGLFDRRLRANLNLIRKIRNTFAHTPTPISFRHPLIINECSKLTLSARTVECPPETPRARHQFSVACIEATVSFNEVLDKLIQKRLLSLPLDELPHRSA